MNITERDIFRSAAWGSQNVTLPSVTGEAAGRGPSQKEAAFGRVPFAWNGTDWDITDTTWDTQRNQGTFRIRYGTSYPWIAFGDRHSGCIP